MEILGRDIIPHIKFKLPRNMDTTNTFNLKCVRNGNVIGDFGSLYENISVSYNIVDLNLRIEENKFVIYKRITVYDSNNKLYFELDTIYRITPDSTYTSDFKLGILNGTIDYTSSLLDYTEQEGLGSQRIIQFRFNELITGISF